MEKSNLISVTNLKLNKSRPVLFNVTLRYLFLCFFTMFSLNCWPVFVGGLILKSTKTRHDKQVFLTEFYKTNLEREKAGLPPLDICIAKYQFDKGWALEDYGCRKKIAAYERGEIDDCGRTIKKNSPPG